MSIKTHNIKTLFRSSSIFVITQSVTQCRCSPLHLEIIKSRNNIPGISTDPRRQIFIRSGSLCLFISLRVRNAQEYVTPALLKRIERKENVCSTQCSLRTGFLMMTYFSRRNGKKRSHFIFVQDLSLY